MRRPAILLLSALGLTATLAVSLAAVPSVRRFVFRQRRGAVPLSESVRDRFLRAERFELLSLDPLTRDFSEKKPGFFHGFKILGRATVEPGERRARLVETVYRSSRAASPSGDVAACFEPEHGLRLLDGGATLDAVLCFHCGQGYFYGDVDSEACGFSAQTAKADLRTFDDALDALKVSRVGVR